MISKLCIVAAHEYKHEVLTRGFLVAILVAPALLALIIGIGFWADAARYDGRPIGYVDHSGWLTDPIAPPAADEPSLFSSQRKPVALVAYVSEELAQTALQSAEIQAYYVLPSDYLESRKVELVYIKPPGSNATSLFLDFLKVNLLADRPADIALRAREGSYMTARTPDGSRQLSQRAGIGIIAPMLMSIVFMVLFMASSTSLVQAVVKEKESRTMEVMLTSISPAQLIGGKMLGIVGMGLTLLAAWLIGIGLEMLVGAQLLGTEWIRYIHIAPRTLGTILASAVLSYVLFAGLMTTAGAAMTDAQESQQVGGLLAFSFAVPMWAVQALVEHPQSPLAIGLSLFPLTSLTSLCVSMTFASIPTWQIIASLTILALTAAASIWLAGRALRLGMLRYGKRLNWRELLGRGQAVAVAHRGS